MLVFMMDSYSVGVCPLISFRMLIPTLLTRPCKEENAFFVASTNVDRPSGHETSHWTCMMLHLLNSFLRDSNDSGGGPREQTIKPAAWCRRISLLVANPMPLVPPKIRKKANWVAWLSLFKERDAETARNTRNRWVTSLENHSPVTTKFRPLNVHASIVR